MNLRDILAEIKRTLKEPPTGGHWSDAELTRRVNIGQKKIVRHSDCLQTTTTILSVAEQGVYNKPANFLKIIRITYNKNRLIGIPVADLDIWSGGVASRVWQDDIGTPTNYIEYPTNFLLYPKPAANGDTIQIEHILKPNPLTLPDDIPFNGVEYLEDYRDLLVSFVLWRCLLEDGNQLYGEHKNDFIQGVMSLRGEMKGRPDVLSSFDIIRTAGNTRKPLPYMR